MTIGTATSLPEVQRTQNAILDAGALSEHNIRAQIEYTKNALRSGIMKFANYC